MADKEQRAIAVKAYRRRGFTLVQIAKELGVSTSTVSSIIRSFDISRIQPQRKTVSKQDLAEALKSMTITAAAEHFGVSRYTIHKAMKDYGLSKQGISK